VDCCRRRSGSCRRHFEELGQVSVHAEGFGEHARATKKRCRQDVELKLLLVHQSRVQNETGVYRELSGVVLEE